jgi:hypothetical protein
VGQVYISDSAALKADIRSRALKTTTISTTSPLTGGGDLSANRTFAIDTTKVVLFNDTLPLGKIATKKALSDGLALKRNLNNHDSLSKLDEKSYESLTSKPVLTVTQDLPYSSVITLDSSDVILTADIYNTLTQVGNEIVIGTDTTKIITRYDTSGFATYTEMVARDTLVQRYARTRDALKVSKADSNINGSYTSKKYVDGGLATRQIAGSYRTMTNHDSLSKLDEKSYESLTSKPVLTVVHDLPYSSVISLDSSDVILTAGGGNKLTQVGNEIVIEKEANWEKEVSSDAENNWTIPFPIRPTSVIIYNGTPLRSGQWSGSSTTTLTVAVAVKKYDHLILIN